MLAVLCLALATGSPQGWPVSARVVEAIVAFKEPNVWEAGQLASTLDASGNKALALSVLDRTNLRSRFAAYDGYRRAGDVDALVKMAERAGTLSGTESYPRPIHDALWYPSQATLDGAIQYIASLEAVGTGYDIGWANIPASEPVMSAYEVLSVMLRQRELYAESYYVAEHYLDYKRLQSLLSQIPRNPYGNHSRSYSDLMQPMLNGLLDRVIAKYPDMFSDRWLFRLAALSGSKGLIATSVEKMLADRDLPGADAQVDNWGFDYTGLIGVVMKLVEAGDDATARRVLTKNRQFLITAFREGRGCAENGANFEGEDSRVLARLLDDKTLSEIQKQNYELVTTSDDDSESYYAAASVSTCAQILYFENKSDEIERLVKLASRSPIGGRNIVSNSVAALYLKDGRYEEAIEFVLKTAPDEAGWVFRSAVSSLYRKHDEEAARALASWALDRLEETDNYGPIFSYINLVINIGLKDRAHKLLDKFFGGSAEADGRYDSETAAYAYAALGEGERAIKTYQLTPPEEWIVSAHLGTFLQTMAYGVGPSWIFEDGRYEKLIAWSNAKSEPFTMIFLTLDLMRWVQEDKAAFELLLSEFSQAWGAYEGKDREFKERMLENLISAEVPEPGHELSTSFGYVETRPPLSVENQERLLDVMRVRFGGPYSGRRCRPISDHCFSSITDGASIMGS